MSTVHEQLDEAALQKRLEEQKRVVARLVSEGKSAVEANAVLYQLSDALCAMRERRRTPAHSSQPARNSR